MNEIHAAAPPVPPWIRMLALLAILNVAAIVAALAARLLFDIAPMQAFRIFFHALPLGMLLGAAAAAAMIAGWLSRRRRWLKHAAVAAAAGLLPAAAAVALMGPGAFMRPPIHDITTDPDDPPLFVAVHELRVPGENSLDYGGAELAGTQRAAYPDLIPLSTALDRDAAHDRALSVVDDLGWNLIAEERSTGRIEAFERSRLFGFIDDVVIRVRASGDGAHIDLRSASRVGIGDLGANADRIRRFQHAWIERDRND
jgi:uncharacterized protein (DUF1499 family)